MNITTKIIGTLICTLIATILIWLILIDTNTINNTIFGYTIPHISTHVNKIIQYIILAITIITPIIIFAIPMTNVEKIHQLESKYTHLTSKPEWQETDAIVKGTQIPGFADNIPAHKSVLQSCYPFIRKNHTTLVNIFPPPETIAENEKIIAEYKTKLDEYEATGDAVNIEKYKQRIKAERLDLYGPAIECSNLAKIEQTPAKLTLQEAHDTCIDTLQKQNSPQYDEHISTITNLPKSQVKTQTIKLTPEAIELKSNKLKQLRDCTSRLKNY